MEQDSLKSAWQGLTTETKSHEELNDMIRKKAHPVLRNICKQLTVEIVAFTAFLLVYYDFFDGNKKPWWANLLLVTAMTIVIMYNLVGYRLTQQHLKGDNMIQSLKDQLNKLKTYMVAFIVSRILAAACLLIFFSSVVSFNRLKYWILAGIIITSLIQLGMLVKVWYGRLRSLKQICENFSEI
jgi:hypothetical protein